MSQSVIHAFRLAHLQVFQSYFKSVTYWPTLSKFRGGPVKKTTLYLPSKKDVELKPRDEDLLSVRAGRGGLGFGISDGIVFIFSKLASFHILREQHPFIFSPS